MYVEYSPSELDELRSKQREEFHINNRSFKQPVNPFENQQSPKNGGKTIIR